MSGLEDPEAAIIALFRVVNRYVGKLAADARRIPRLSDASDPQHASRDRDDADALGHATTARAPAARRSPTSATRRRPHWQKGLAFRVSSSPAA